MAQSLTPSTCQPPLPKVFWPILTAATSLPLEVAAMDTPGEVAMGTRIETLEAISLDQHNLIFFNDN